MSQEFRIQPTQLVFEKVVLFGCRTFELRLTPDRDLFAEDVVFEGTRGPLEFELQRAYKGTLKGELFFLHALPSV
jgi:hypothetical protein